MKCRTAGLEAMHVETRRLFDEVPVDKNMSKQTLAPKSSRYIGDVLSHDPEKAADTSAGELHATCDAGGVHMGVAQNFGARGGYAGFVFPFAKGAILAHVFEPAILVYITWEP